MTREEVKLAELEQRHGATIVIAVSALKRNVNWLADLGEHDLAQACADALETWEEDQLK